MCFMTYKLYLTISFPSLIKWSGAGIGNSWLWAKSNVLPIFRNKVSLKYNQICSFFWLFLNCNDIVESFWQRKYDLWSLKYFAFCPLQKSFADPWSEVVHWDFIICVIHLHNYIINILYECPIKQLILIKRYRSIL